MWIDTTNGDVLCPTKIDGRPVSTRPKDKAGVTRILGQCCDLLGQFLYFVFQCLVLSDEIRPRLKWHLEREGLDW